MFKNAAGKKTAGPILLAVLLVGVLAAARSYLTASINRRRRDEPVIEVPLSYETAHARLRRCPRWHVVDSRPGAPCFWVTREQRQAKELAHTLLFEDRTRCSWADRRGVVRIEPVEAPTASICVDEYDTSYWRVVGDVYLAGDPKFVREVAEYLLDDAGR
ncbi:MAG TPA: hypothetical protein VE999_05080 [Gemmataceae bacterium]|nr:hypothetical protein [Gemmataceae bacterium]